MSFDAKLLSSLSMCETMLALSKLETFKVF